MQTLAEAAGWLEGRVARKRAAARPDLLAGCFPEQRGVVLDRSSLKAEFCTRRAAKTFTWGLEAINDSYDWPTANYLFLGLVREEAKRIFWKDVLKVIDRKYGCGMRLNESTLTATMPNGATIYIGAADANEDEMRKLLGQKYRKIAIDEAQDWQHTNLEELVFHVLKPACADFRGSISLLGTPGKINQGLFHEITPSSVQAGIRGERNPGAAGWSVHCWDTHSNTAVVEGGSCDTPGCRHTVSEHWAKEIGELLAMKPGIEETPWFRRNYRGEKVVEEDALVYRYAIGRNDFAGKLPLIDAPGQWHYILGIDLGYNDPSAFVLWAYHDSDPNLYGIEALKRPSLDVTAVAQHVKRFEARYPQIEAEVIDGANKQAVMELSNRHELHKLVPADKTGKSDFIELMNADYITGRIKLSPECAALREEYATLIWDKKKQDATGKREEHAACDNHAADAALYGWRYCYQYLFREKTKQPTPGSREWAVAEEKRMFERAQREVRAAKENLGGEWGVDLHPNDWGESVGVWE